MAEDVRDPRWVVEFAPRVGSSTRGRLRAVAQMPPPDDRIFGLFTESVEYQYQVSCRVCELQAQGDGGLMYSWESVPPKCFCGRPMEWIVRGPNQPPLVCHRRGPTCAADRMWQSHAWRCVCQGCANGYLEICRGCVPGPLCEGEPCSVDNQHFGFEAIADLCTYSLSVAGGKVWIFVADSTMHTDEVVWLFDPDTVAVERVPLPTHPDDSMTCRRIVNACSLPDGRRIYFEAYSSPTDPLTGILDSISRTFEPFPASPGSFRGRFASAGSSTVGMTDERLYTLSKGTALGWEADVELHATTPCMAARGPADDTLVVFGSDGPHDANGATLVGPRYIVEIAESGAKAPRPLRPVSSPAAVAHLPSGGCGLLPQALRYGAGAKGYLLFSLEGDVFRFRDEDILLPEQIWHPPQWDLYGGDAGVVTFSFATPCATELKAHVYVLHRHEYFRRLLDGWSEGQTRTVLVEDVEPKTFGQLLGFLYTGSLDRDLSMTALAALLRAANKYLIADLAMASLRRLQQALRTRAAVRDAGSEALAQVLGIAEEVGGDGAALLQDATEAILVHRPELLEDDGFLVPLARGSPAALRALLAAFRACSTLDLAKVTWRRECGTLGPHSKGVRPLWVTATLGPQGPAAHSGAASAASSAALVPVGAAWPLRNGWRHAAHPPPAW